MRETIMRAHARDWVVGRYSIEATAARYQELFDEAMAA